jgi:hypothetical protein
MPLKGKGLVQTWRCCELPMQIPIANASFLPFKGRDGVMGAHHIDSSKAS